MWQVLFVIPGLGIRVYGYGFMLFLAFLASMQLAAWLARRERLSPDVIYDMALTVFIGGLVGARLFYVITDRGVHIRTFADVFKVWEGGIVLYGSVIGGTLAFFGYRTMRSFPLLPTIDVLAPAVALGVAIGRIGCFLNGCCFGDLCRLPWAVKFPQPTDPWIAHRAARLIPTYALESLPVHPTQLYSALDGLILTLLLLAYFPLRRRDGEVMALLMVTYPITRLLIEYLRDDDPAFFAGMTVAQNVSILLMICGIIYWAWLAFQPRRRFADKEPLPEVAMSV